MCNDLTDVTLVIDRSGSMSAVVQEAEQGINHFIEEQKKQPGECLFSLFHFDNVCERVHSGVPIKYVPYYKLVPRGMTALLDAVGRVINETGKRLEAMPESDRPGLVVVVIVTDGEENFSREFTKARIKEMIEHQQSVYSWKFTFLGANQDAFAEAWKIGIPKMSVANYSKPDMVFKSASMSVSRMRDCSLSGQEVRCEYTPQERSMMA